MISGVELQWKGLPALRSRLATLPSVMESPICGTVILMSCWAAALDLKPLIQARLLIVFDRPAWGAVHPDCLQRSAQRSRADFFDELVSGRSQESILSCI